MEKQKSQHIVFIDSECIMCNTFMQIITRADKKEQFSFMPLQSPKSQKILEPFQEKDLDETVVFLSGGHVYIKSEAVLQIARMLPFPWRLIYYSRIFPRRWLDSVYDWVARNRYKWFGKNNFCPLPNLKD